MDGQLIQQWMKSCRLCLLDDGVKLPIFGEEGIIREVAHKIQTCFPMIVLYNADPLSKIICQRCMFMLDTVFNFRQKCIESNQTFVRHVREMKSNSSSVKQYILALEKNATRDQNALVAADIRTVQITTPVVTPEAAKKSNSSVQRPTTFPKRSAAVKTHVRSVEKDPLTLDNLSCSPVKIKQEKIDCADESSSGKSTPLIISVVGSYSDAQTVNDSEPVRKAAPELRERRSLDTIKVKQEGQLIRPKSQSKFRTSKVITPWHCKFCNKYYKSKDTQYKHRKYFCPYKPVPCKSCNEIFKTSREMIEHSARHLRVLAYLKEEDLLPCQICDRRFANLKMLAAHKQAHGGRMLLDTLQRPQPDSSNTLRTRPGMTASSVNNIRHRVFKSRFRRGNFSNVPRSYCPYCPASYARHTKLTYHKKMAHIEEYLEEMEYKKELAQKHIGTPACEEEPAKEVTSETVPAASVPERTNVIRTALHKPGPLSKQKAKRPVHQGLLRELLNKRILKCPICNRVMGSPVGLQNHMRSHNDGAPVGPKMNRCMYCSRLFGSKGGLAYHLATQHSHGDTCKDAFRCQPCNITFASRQEWFTHKFSHNKGHKMKRKVKPGQGITGTAPEPKLLLCSYCNQVFSEAAELKAHQLTHKVAAVSSPANPKTPVASEPLASQPPTSTATAAIDLDQGVQKSDGSIVWPCTLCNKVCSTKRNLRRHTTTHELRAHCSHHCNLCTKKFISKAALVRHDAFIHSSAKSFRCQKCAKIFFRKGSYLNHLNTACERPARLTESILPTAENSEADGEPSNQQFHELNQMKLCDKCGFTRTIGHKCNLWIKKKETNQIKRHISRRSYKCRICGATFASSYSHNSHMKAHVNSRNKNLHILNVPDLNQGSLNFADVPLLEDSVVHEFLPGPALNSAAPLDLSCVEPTAGDASGSLDQASSGGDRTAAIDGESLHTPKVPSTNGIDPSVENLFFQCPNCTKTFHSQQGLAAHAVSHEGTATNLFDCPFCTRNCNDSQGLNLHVLLCHPENDVTRDNSSVPQNVDV